MRTRALARWPFVTAALLAALPAAGCRNPFAPATPEPPSDSGSTINISANYSNVDAVLNTLVQAISARGQGNGPDAYINSFADSSQNEPPLAIGFDPDVVAERIQAGKAAPAWTRDKELVFYRYLGTLSPSSTDTYDLKFDPYGSAPADITTGTSNTLYREYTLTAFGVDGSQTLIAVGRVDLTITQVATNRWKITTWSDHRDPAYAPGDVTHPCFSRLRIDSAGV